MDEEVRDSIVKRAESLSRSLASAAGYHVILKDLLALDNMVYKIKSANQDVLSVAIINEAGEIIVHSDPSLRGTKIESQKVEEVDDSRSARPANQAQGQIKLLVAESPVEFLGKNLGKVRLEVDWSVLLKAQARARRQVLPIFGLIMLAGFAGSFLLSRRITRPIRELTRGVEIMKEGRKNQPLKIYSADELGQLTASFNEMAELLTSQKEKLANYAHELEEAYVSTVKILAAAIEARDRYTLGHSTRVAEMAVALAKEVGLSHDDIELIEIACLFHDVGKIRIPDAILHKRGRLSPEERLEMEKHPEYGAEILSKAPCLYKYIPAVRHHHEWYNGNGYPDGLRGENIPMTAAIISLADAFDAMTSNRPYRKALSLQEALDYIRQNSGNQFHPELSEVFIRVMAARENLEVFLDGNEDEIWTDKKPS